MCRRKLGDVFYFGQGVGANHSEAARHYALNNLDAQSTFNLAWLTERGRGVPQDRERAKALYARATELGGGTAPGGGWRLRRATPSFPPCRHSCW